ncbi:MAG TPA: hypothetical protein VFZ23_02770 [Pyrinomonadaceae bacterium]
MKTLSVIVLIVFTTFSAFTQERVLEPAEFDRVFSASYEIWTVWKGKAFRKSVTVESRSPKNNYKLSRVLEFDGTGASSAVYNEHVEGKEPRLTREIIGVDHTNYIRDGRRGNWWLRGDAKREESHKHLAYAPDPMEVQAVRAHFVRSQFDTTRKESSYVFVGTEQIKNEPVTVYRATERIAGYEKKTGLRMQTDAVMKYWFGRDGMILRSESVSNGHVGNDVYHLKITAVWELDPSISITPPIPPS